MRGPILLVALGLCLLAFVPLKTNSAPATDSALSLNVVVMDKKGTVLTDVKREDVRLTIGNAPAEIISFERASGPLSVGILLDTSGSTSSDSQKRKLLEGLKHFLSVSDPANEYFLISFREKAGLLADWTSDRAGLLSEFMSMPAKGGTALYDATQLGLQKVITGRYPRRLLILISDGQDSVSKSTFVQTRDWLRHSNIPLYSVLIRSGSDAGSALGVEGASVLEELSETTGARSLAPLPEKPNEFTELFDQIASEVAGQFLFKVSPAESLSTGKWLKVSMKISQTDSAGKRQERFVKTRQGVYKN
jgi:Ca-activated chloride channel homolog